MPHYYEDPRPVEPPEVGSSREPFQEKLPFQRYFPNYPGDPLQDLLSNRLIDWFRLFQKSGRIKGAIMNTGINPNSLIANQPRRVGGYGIPMSNFKMNSIPPVQSPLGLNIPHGFQRIFPDYIRNVTAPSQFKPGPTFRYQTDPEGTRFGVQDLPNNPGLTPAPSAPTLEGLLKIIRGG